MNIQNYQKLNKQIALVATFVVIILLASSLSELTWKLVDYDDTTPKIEHAVNSKQLNTLDLPKNLFGVSKSSTNQNYNNVGKTRLNLTLIGILNQKDQQLAIIKQGNGKERIFKLNDIIVNNVSIKEIYSKYIIIENNGHSEKLNLKRRDINFSKKQTKNISLISAPNKSKLQGYLQQLSVNPKSLLSVVSVRPNYTKSGMRGFVIAPSNEHKLFKELGFKKNDIILSINNSTLNSLSQAITLRKALSHERYFDFEIERTGQIRTLSVNLN
jgi:type II secretion system protein C